MGVKCRKVDGVSSASRPIWLAALIGVCSMAAAEEKRLLRITGHIPDRCGIELNEIVDFGQTPAQLTDALSLHRQGRLYCSRRFSLKLWSEHDGLKSASALPAGFVNLVPYGMNFSWKNKNDQEENFLFSAKARTTVPSPVIYPGDGTQFPATAAGEHAAESLDVMITIPALDGPLAANPYGDTLYIDMQVAN